MKNRSSYRKAYRQTHKEQIKAWQEAHKEEQQAYQKVWRQEHKEEIKAKVKAYYAAHKEEINAQCRVYRATHKAELAAASRQRNQTLKLGVLQHYSEEHPRCAHCGIDNLIVLTIDHIDNRGAEHRRKVGAGTPLYVWLKKNDYPEGFQVLCRNCNFQKYWLEGMKNAHL